MLDRVELGYNYPRILYRIVNIYVVYTSIDILLSCYGWVIMYDTSFVQVFIYEPILEITGLERLRTSDLCTAQSRTISSFTVSYFTVA